MKRIYFDCTYIILNNFCFIYFLIQKDQVQNIEFYMKYSLF